MDADQNPNAGAPELVSPEMVEAAMIRLWEYEVACTYIDRDMMTEILRAALLGRDRTSNPVKFTRELDQKNN